MNGSACLAVMYHYVRDRAGGPHASIRGLDVAAFTAQLDQLTALLEPIDWPLLATGLRGAASLPERCFVVTFDDGLADHAEVVCPILESRGLRGVFFVAGRPLADRDMLPAHQIHLLQAALGDDGLGDAVTRFLASAPVNGDGAHAEDWLNAVDDHAARRMYHYESPARAALKYLLTQSLPRERRSQLLNALFARHVGDPREWAARWYLSRSALKVMQARGHTVGGHSFGHEAYVRLSPDEQVRDLRRTAMLLSEMLGEARRPFSYPYGSFDDATRRACAAAGFAAAFTTEAVWIDADADPFALGRVDTIAVDAFLEHELLITHE